MASRAGQRDLTVGPIGATLLAFAVPTLLSSVLQSLNGSINTIWVGRFLGEGALAATSNANMIMFLLMAFVFGFGMAATILIGQAFGRRDLDEVRRVVGTAIGGFVPVAAAIGILGPAPAMGIAGSATATVIANYAALIGLLIYIYARDLPIRLRGAELRYLVPQRDLLRTMIIKGLPMGLQMIVISSSGLATLGLVNREGVETTAAFGVTMQLWTYLQMPAMALGAAVSAMAAQNIGAGKWERMSAITRSGIVYNLLITGLLVVLLAVADRPALALFLGGDSAALPIARHIQLLATWSFLLFGVTIILFGAVRANGAVLGPLIIFAIGLFPVRLGFALLAYPRLGADALWLSFPVGSLAIMAMASAFYLHGGWRKVRMGLPPPSAEELTEEAQADCEPGGRLNPSG